MIDLKDVVREHYDVVYTDGDVDIQINSTKVSIHKIDYDAPFLLMKVTVKAEDENCVGLFVGNSIGRKVWAFPVTGDQFNL